MTDVKEMRIFCAEQIEVPETLPDILKNYSKAVIRANPENIISYLESILKIKKLKEIKIKKNLRQL